MEPLEPSQMIVGNKVSVLYDNGSWYHGQIARIAQTGKAGKGKVLEIVFDDGDELTLYTWKKKDTEGFRHDAERDDPITRRWGVVYRLLCTCGEDQWFQRCHTDMYLFTQPAPQGDDQAVFAHTVMAPAPSWEEGV